MDESDNFDTVGNHVHAFPQPPGPRKIALSPSARPQPVDWFPWGDEAFTRARREDKPIFLSVGYSTCHWCHVMEHESFESAAIAAFLNEHFINIKVDREERPDVDQVYMTFVQATTGHGGWPMSVWLTPDLRPFYGGTYFPPTDVPGRSGFITLLRRIADLWQTDRKQIEEKAHSLLAALRETETQVISERTTAWDANKTARQALSTYTRMFDAAEGGFGAAPKFPRPVNLQFLLHLATQEKGENKNGAAALGMAQHTLRKMAAGGMHDHLGGGFHRYSVDSLWHVPHFEKMLYDQAQLAQVYLTAFQMTGEDAFAQVARDILQYVAQDLTSPEGGFFSAEDADSLPKAESKRKTEGAFYVWTYDEIRQLLAADQIEEFCAVYGIEPNGNVPVSSDPHGELEGANVLIQRLPVSEVAEQRLSDARSLLLAKRNLRPRPHLDDKTLTAWNGLMIGAFARSAQILGETSHLHSAQRAATFIRDHLFDAATGELQRSYREGPSGIHGFATDYAFLISGLLDLYEADFDPAWLKWARQLQDTFDLHFGDKEHGGYFSTTDRDPALLLRMKEDYDGAEPAPTSVAAINLWRLGQLFHDEALLTRARRAVESFASRLEAQPFGMPLLLMGALLVEMPPIHLILHSPDHEHPGLKALLTEARRRHLPNLVVIVIADVASRELFAPDHPVIAGLPEKVTEPTAYLCENYACQLPMAKAEDVRKAIARL